MLFLFRFCSSSCRNFPFVLYRVCTGDECRASSRCEWQEDRLVIWMLNVVVFRFIFRFAKYVFGCHSAVHVNLIMHEMCLSSFSVFRYLHLLPINNNLIRENTFGANQSTSHLAKGFANWFKQFFGNQSSSYDSSCHEFWFEIRLRPSNFTKNGKPYLARNPRQLIVSKCALLDSLAIATHNTHAVTRTSLRYGAADTQYWSWNEQMKWANRRHNKKS